MIAAGVAGLSAAFALTVDKIRLLEDPTYVPACSFNAVLSCASIMTSDQAEAFGFPNPLLGLAGFAGLLALGMAAINGGVLANWLWLVIQAGLTFALLFVHWLFLQSVYEIEALCPFCMLVWVATITVFFYVTLANLLSERIRTPQILRPVLDVATRYHSVIVIAWLALLAAQIGIVFRDHWATIL